MASVGSPQHDGFSLTYFTSGLGFGEWGERSRRAGDGTAWVVDFTNGIVSRGDKISNTFGGLAWCVRGPMQESTY